uniref:Uncharacterized protein n=1 Tax=Aegilops tauschii subsp. strangulata TaxID=200361 RepID=A0A453M8A8_AEGTS
MNMMRQAAVLLSSVVHLLPADARGGGGRRGERPGHRDRVLRRAPGGRGGAGCAAPVPPRLGQLRLRLPRPRAHHRRPVHVHRPRGRHLHQRCGRPHVLPGPPPGR